LITRQETKSAGKDEAVIRNAFTQLACNAVAAGKRFSLEQMASVEKKLPSVKLN
jgi:hypothetical protein